MQDHFEANLAWVLLQEGGFAKLANDEVTNLGVKRSTWAGWVDRPVTIEELKSLTVPRVTPLYLKQYYIPCLADKIIHPVDLCVFDFAVNSGVGRSLAVLSTQMNISLDNKSRDMLIDAINTHPDVAKLINQFCDRRLSFVRGLKNHYLYGKGWEARIARLRAHCLDLLTHPCREPAV